MKDGLPVIDADGHVIEPDGMWAEYIEPAFRGREPVVENPAFGLIVDGIPINTWTDQEYEADAAGRARRKERLLATFQENYPRAYERGFDAEAQLADMDVEGIDVGVLYPSFGLFATAADGLDPALATAICRAYNNWMADFCSADPARLRGVAMIPKQDPKAAAIEAERAVSELGLCGVFVRPNPVDGHNLDEPFFDPLYGALESLGVPLGVHEGGRPRLPQVGVDRFSNLEQRHIATHPLEQMLAAVSLIYGGVLERFPRLHVVFLESGCGWVPFWLERMDDHYEHGKRRDFGGGTGINMPPSEYFRRQCHVSADAEEAFVEHVISWMGADSVVFSSDYPHPDSKFPHAVESFIGLDGVSREDMARVLWDNAADLYGFDDLTRPSLT